MNNYSQAGTRRVERNINLSYGDDYEKAEKLLWEMIKAEPRILKKPAALIAMQSISTCQTIHVNQS